MYVITHFLINKLQVFIMSLVTIFRVKNNVSGVILPQLLIVDILFFKKYFQQ